MALPSISLITNNIIYKEPSNGDLVYKYAPFKNLKDLNVITGTTDLFPLRVPADVAKINIDKPIDIDIEEAYDGSVNIILNDKENPLKMINSRFYLTSSTTYNIADRKGNLDTNIYTVENFDSETSLVKTVKSIISVDFLGINSGGNMKVGSYNFYFKLADSDGNESDFISESGNVVCHIGDVNQPKSIRGGQLNENSGKLIKFRLNNLDLAYDYINVYYTRSSGSGDSETILTYKITDKFKINKLNTEISITGYENHEEISVDEINVQYTSFKKAESNTNCQNITFVGNVTKDYSLFKTLEKYSLFITPEIALTENIGNLNSKYVETYPDSGYEYYNVHNIYYKLGYWDEEIYRFGIVYILDDYSLSPVFNIRGIKELSQTVTFDVPNTINDEIEFKEDNLIEGTNENTKGVFKINSNAEIFTGDSPIKPIGIKFNFNSNVVQGTTSYKGLRDLTRGFFIVRQKRIPTILAQAVGIGTSGKSYTPILKGTSNTLGKKIVNTWFAESFLSSSSKGPILKNSLFSLSNDIRNNALLCPEASLRIPIFNSLFNSSEFKLIPFKYKPSSDIFYDSSGSSKQFYLGSLAKRSWPGSSINSTLTLIEPGIDLTKNDTYEFSSKSGDALVPYKHSDPILGDYEDIEKNGSANFNTTVSKLRGEFNTYVGCNTNYIQHGDYYNIFEKGYDFENQWKNYFKLRYNDSSPFMAVGNRTMWSELEKKTGSTYTSQTHYRGDCYINTFTHRMNWNFIDPDIPTNKRIVDPYTWYKNFRVIEKASTLITSSGTTITINESGNQALSYKKLLPLFTYKKAFEQSFSGEPADNIAENSIIEPDNKKYKKYSEINGVFGAEKINRPDVNAVPLGHWATFKICSNINLAMRDLDFSYPEEEAVHKYKRGFYPLQALDQNNPLPESKIINQGISKTLSHKYYFEVPDVPFIKSSFTSRIYYSEDVPKTSFTNGNRVFLGKNYTDYTMEYGSLVKLVEWYGTLIAIMEHGVLMIPVKERSMMINASGEAVYINTDTVLPENPKVLSNTFGSLWPESVIKTSRFIYGIDTVGKKIWRTNGQTFEVISDMKIQKFLNDNINLKESDRTNKVGVNYIKSHYNAFKQDILFVFKYNKEKWHLCWNELLGKWVTQYTWFPEFSENINNIFYTFGDQTEHPKASNNLFKHGFAGTEEQLGDIQPTKWYEEQHPFEYEFVVADVPGVQKIFNNLKIVSNLAEPNSFYYEIVGEGFDWNKDKNDIANFTTEQEYLNHLSANPSIVKLPFIIKQSFDEDDENLQYFYRNRDEVLRDITIRSHNKTKEKLVNVYQKGLDIKNPLYGRRRGNMQYLEDSWDVQIQPIFFKYIYFRNNIKGYTNLNEMRIRDKYIKIRVKYDGKQYAIINALKTLFTISYA